ncbi:MAG: hypothetical protein KJ042_02790 [Deltaproteobacteria bacterium]|nr:hypothetical protein [Deltaproteobacteria bacterium]
MKYFHPAKSSFPAAAVAQATLIFVLLMAVLSVPGCARDSNGSGETEAGSPYIECFEGETAAAQTSGQQLPPKAKGEEGSSDFPEGLPACPPFDDTMFFETPPIEVYEQFAEAVFPAKSIPCSVFLDGGEAQFDCPFDLKVPLTWTWSEGNFPFVDGDVVRLYMEYRAYDPPTYGMAVFDLERKLLALASNYVYMFFSTTLDCVDIDSSGEGHYACEYETSDAPPLAWPDSQDVECCGWTRVFGLSRSGHFAYIEWNLEFPGETVISDDGDYYVAMPVHFYGETYDEEFPDFVGFKQEFAFQIIRSWD